MGRSLQVVIIKVFPISDMVKLNNCEVNNMIKFLVDYGANSLILSFYS